MCNWIIHLEDPVKALKAIAKSIRSSPLSHIKVDLISVVDKAKKQRIESQLIATLISSLPSLRWLGLSLLGMTEAQILTVASSLLELKSNEIDLRWVNSLFVFLENRKWKLLESFHCCWGTVKSIIYWTRESSSVLADWAMRPPRMRNWWANPFVWRVNSIFACLRRSELPRAFCYTQRRIPEIGVYHAEGRTRMDMWYLLY